MLCRLLAYLPRLGWSHETAQLLETIQGMEFEHPQGPGAITEFDRVFQIGCKSIVRCAGGVFGRLVAAARPRG